MSKVEIELHTIATYNNKQYELQDLLNDLLKENERMNKMINRSISINDYKKLQEENQKLKRQIQIKDKWCQLIIDIGFDYDGYNDSENLKKIIDELVEYSHRAIKNDDKTVAYVGGDGKKENILFEEIKGEISDE